MENIKKILCNNFNRLVEDSGFKPKDIIQRLKIDKSTYSRWSNGKAFPEWNNIVELSEMLGISPLEFYKKETDPKPVTMASALLKRMAMIPDEVYDMAPKIGDDADAWKAVIRVMKEEIKDIELKKEKEAKVNA